MAVSETPTFLIFGATGGIGSAVCRRLARRGWKVILAARDGERLRMLADEIAGVPIICDVTESASVQEAVSQAAQVTGRLDGVLNSVGSILLKPAHLLTDSEWATTLSLNLTSAFHVVRESTKAMMTTGGSIVLVSSVAGRFGLVNHEAIAAAKAGVIGLTLSAAASYAPRNIRVNCVAPGLVRTPLAARFVNVEASLKASQAMHPLGRIGEPEDVASPIEWLLDPATQWVTGQVLGIDGGLGSVRGRG